MTYKTQKPDQRRPPRSLNSLLCESGISLPEWIDVQMLDGPARQQDLWDADKFQTAPLDDSSAVLNSLKQIDWAFESAKTDYLSHDIHPYPAKFIPQIPRYLIAALSHPGDMVWDPFGGSGTTALEAILLGRRCISSDANPLAALIGRAKTLSFTVEQERLINEFIDELRALSSDDEELERVLLSTRARWTGHIPAIPNVERWFDQKAVEELAYIRWRISEIETENCKVLCAAAFSRSVLRASFQDSETRYVSKRREIVRGDVFRIACTHIQTALKKVRTLSPHLHFRSADFKAIDLRLPLSPGGAIQPNSIDAVVTSPPYPNATDYHLYHRFRMFWLGYDPRELATQEIGSHLRNQKERLGFHHYVEEMEACLQNIFIALRPGRYAALVLGDAVFAAQEYKTAKSLAKSAAESGFQVIDVIDRKIHSTKRSFVAAARRLRTEQILLLRKPRTSAPLRLLPASYKPWAYEEDLRLREIEALAKGRKLREVDGAFEISEPTQEEIASLRQLTFIHRITGENYRTEPTWQAVLENGDEKSQSSRKDPKYATHGIHPYKGKFYPQLAKCLFNIAQLQPGNHILDPFCGSGTVLLEAALNGFRSTGVDVNPLAVAIARAKTQVLQVEPELRDRLLASYQSRLSASRQAVNFKDYFPESAHRELTSWFAPMVLERLATALVEIEKVGNEGVQALLRILVSSIVREVSQQDPKDLRIRRRKNALSDAPVFEMLSARLVETRRRLRRVAEVSNWAPYPYQRAQVLQGDIKESATLNQVLGDGPVDAVVTSPPYATALPYIDTDRLSLLLLFGMTAQERSPVESLLIGNREISRGRRSQVEGAIESGDWKRLPSRTARRIVAEVFVRNKESIVGFRRQNMAALLYLYFAEMAQAMSNADRALKAGASAFFVIGDSRTEAGGINVQIRSGEVLLEIGESLGWQRVDVIPITVTKENRLHNKNSITENAILHFRKSS